MSTIYSGSLSTALATSHKFRYIILFYHVLFVIIFQRASNEILFPHWYKSLGECFYISMWLSI